VASALWRDARISVMDRHSMLSIPLRKFVDVDLETTDRRAGLMDGASIA
jgi:hypothetical protein